MSVPVLKIVSRTQGNNEALKDATVTPKGCVLEFEDVPVLVHAFRRMVRGLEFDVCEMALTTYLCAREHGVRFTALPIFLVRMFHHGAIYHHGNYPVRNPRELEGKRVGVNRGTGTRPSTTYAAPGSRDAEPVTSTPLHRGRFPTPNRPRPLEPTRNSPRNYLK